MTDDVVAVVEIAAHRTDQYVPYAEMTAEGVAADGVAAVEIAAQRADQYAPPAEIAPEKVEALVNDAETGDQRVGADMTPVVGVAAADVGFVARVVGVKSPAFGETALRVSLPFAFHLGGYLTDSQHEKFVLPSSTQCLLVVHLQTPR
jgi:hypothetical protein